MVDSFSRAGSHCAKDREAGEVEVYLVGRTETLLRPLLPSSLAITEQTADLRNNTFKILDTVLYTVARGMGGLGVRG